MRLIARLRLKTRAQTIQSFGLCGIAAVLGLASASAAAHAGSGDSSISIEGLSLWRSDYEGGKLTGDDGGSGTPADPFGIVTKTADFDPGAEAGIRIMANIPARVLGGLLPAGYSWQLGAMYAKGFDGDISLDDPAENTSATYVEDLGGIVDPKFSDANSDQIGAMRMQIYTTLAGYESNVVTPVDSVFNGRAFLGTRFILLSETLSAKLFDDFPANSNDNNHLDGIDVQNNLFGVQAGWEGYFKVASNVSVGGRFAGGLFANHITRDRSFFDQDTPGNAYSDQISDNKFSQMLEANPKVIIGLSEGIDLTIGGTVLWINDVSAAATHWSNLLNLNDKDIRADSDVLFYGVSAGLTFTFN
jgi:hypothetical protein